VRGIQHPHCQQALIRLQGRDQSGGSAKS
jgi:hypothetical protein